MGLDHRCIHVLAGVGHPCHCGIGHDHTFTDFLAWHEERGIPILDSQVS